ncbi:unnamed protein product [Aureobasidium pullulans]|nr:unnamed protein product [Aureobasidium pullulans]
MVFFPNGRSVSCGICGETCNSRKTLVAKCDDVWCGHCLSTQFEIAVKDETKYPASCCNQELDFAIALKLFSTGLAQGYAAAGVEYSCPQRKECIVQEELMKDHVAYLSISLCRCSHEFCYLCSGDWKDCRGGCQHTALDDDDFRPLWHRNDLERTEELLAVSVALLRAQGGPRHPEMDDFLAAVEQTLRLHQMTPQPVHQAARAAPVVEQPHFTTAELEHLFRPRPSIFRPSNNELRRERHARCGAEHFRQHNSEGTCRDCGDVDEEVHLACRYCSYAVCFGCFSRHLAVLFVVSFPSVSDNKPSRSITTTTNDRPRRLSPSGKLGVLKAHLLSLNPVSTNTAIKYIS